MEKPNYYAIIPANVRYNKDLKANEKLLYAEITALSQATGNCFASNNYFANLFEVTPVAISRWVTSLVKLGYIKRQLEYKKGTKQIINRYLSIGIDPINQIVNTPINQKDKDNNTSVIVNNTSINKKDIDNHFNKLWLMYPAERRIDKKKVTANVKKDIYNISIEEWGRILKRYSKTYTEIKFCKHAVRFLNNETYKEFLDSTYKENFKITTRKPTNTKKYEDDRKNVAKISDEEVQRNLEALKSFKIKKVN